LIKLIKKLIILILILSTAQIAQAKNHCQDECTFDIFFRENYQKLLENLCLDPINKRLYDTIFNAYSIKFQGFDYEYKNACAQIQQGNDCTNEKKNYLKSLPMMAMDEYDSFLDDLSFELCGDENLENSIIKKNKKKYRRQFKKLISQNCK